MIGQSAAKGLVNLLLTALIGDGTIQHQANKQKSSVVFMGTDESWIRFKSQVIDRESHLRVRPQSKRAWGKKRIYVVQTEFKAEYTSLRDLSFKEVLDKLDEEDLIVWYLDDGSFHQRKRFMHLYSNKLSESDSLLLIEKFTNLYGIAPKLRVDKKKDGRQFFYLCLNVELSKKFRAAVEKFVVKHKLFNLYYKAGLDQGSSTIAEASRTQESSKRVTSEN